jgi:ABC-type Na+ efflux pump permease subunit
LLFSRVIRENADDGSVSVPMSNVQRPTKMSGRREDRMNAILAAIVIAFVLLVLMILIAALYEVSSIAAHKDHFHKPGEHRRSPRLN